MSRVQSRTGTAAPVVTGLPFPADVERVGNRLVVVTGGGSAAPISGDASVLVVDGDGDEMSADIEAYESDANPDEQRQFDDMGRPLDALSNPSR